VDGLNTSLYSFFAATCKRASIGLVGATDFAGLSVRKAQRPITDDGRASRWSHSFLFSGTRLDRRGPGKTTIESPYIFESDTKVNLRSLLRSGAQESWLGKWCTPDVDQAAVIDMDLTDGERDIVLATALQLVGEQIFYPLEGLLGTWWAIITRQEWKPNPFDNPHAMYCSSFVRYCYREVGRDVAGGNIHLSNTAPEHIAQFCRDRLTVWERVRPSPPLRTRKRGC
jgi:hypothetical protein